MPARKVRVGVNGFGRVGRIVTRCAFASDAIEVVHINEPAGDAATNAYLLQYDSAHGVWGRECSADEGGLILGDKRVTFSAERDPAAINWAEVTHCTAAPSLPGL
jgi:glyceraldehyde 3-phosphate dehydrogenase